MDRRREGRPIRFGGSAVRQGARVQITIRLFARLRDIAGAADLVRDVPEDATVETAWQVLAAEFPAMAPHRSSLSAAVNAEYARFTTALAERDEVVFLPPVSGG